jgi:glucose dehydrogenase
MQTKLREPEGKRISNLLQNNENNKKKQQTWTWYQTGDLKTKWQPITITNPRKILKRYLRLR